LPLFRIPPRLLTSKCPNLFSTYFVKQNAAMRICCFSGRQNAKKEHQNKHNDQVCNWRFLKRWFPEYESFYLSLG